MRFLQWTLILLLVTASGLSAHDGDVHEGTEPAAATRVLGSISFPTSTQSAEAQAAFIQGMLLLHLFEYPFARDQFLLSQKLDAGFAMAYWGEAMTFNHPIWDEQELQAGRDVLMKLGATPETRLAMTPVAREKGLLAAVEILYGAGSKAERDRAYMRAMEQLAAQFPEDHEIQLFYALSIFGVQAGVRDWPSYMLATALAQSVFTENPQHPGAAHYLIHGVDDPIHAVLGLRAARALSVMAPDAGHSQHMTSHIFLAVGMWNDVVQANEAAVAVANAMRAENDLEPRSWGHYNFWLLYGLLQQQRTEEAFALLQAAYAEARADKKSPVNPLELDPDRSLVGSVVQMWARYIIETDGWNEPVAEWSFNSGDSFDPNLTITFIKSMKIARQGLVAQSGQFLSQFRQLKDELAKEIARQGEQAPGDLLYLRRLDVMEQELLAAVEMAKGDKEAAIRHAAEASRLEGEMPYSFGPPFVDLPAAEYLGQLLLEAHKYAEAIEAFETQLERTRLKASALQGLAQAFEAAGNRAEANYAREKLKQIREKAQIPVPADEAALRATEAP
jgi:tetratricopeptide (TPR) repeat protein